MRLTTADEETKEMESEPGEADAPVDAPVDAGSPIRLKIEEDVALQATVPETVRTSTITKRRGIATIVPRTNYGSSPCEINVPRH
ncbi:hypothetical protein CAEBREN_25138 [Caenorhabditis brenneri]|uniref:Uncharacterized protein n=1 Tax=Caenorhabditis brenneri TaxID=135651 RepID=G0MW34_CAEBE|nr:hypothetical protein CAEBREN_25138 [Caenorhabditis brenneri]